MKTPSTFEEAALAVAALDAHASQMPDQFYPARDCAVERDQIARQWGMA